MQQAEVLFLQAEACVQALKNKGVAIAAPDPDIVAKLTAEEAWLHTAIAAESGGSGPDELAGKEKAPEKKEKAGKGAAVVAPPPVPVVEAAPHAEPAPMPTTAAELQAIVPLSVLKGMGLGLAVKEPWIVMNGAAYAWNHFRHIANEQLYLPLLPLYRLTMERLMKATVEEPVEAGTCHVDVPCPLFLCFLFSCMHMVMISRVLCFVGWRDLLQGSFSHKTREQPQTHKLFCDPHRARRRPRRPGPRS